MLATDASLGALAGALGVQDAPGMGAAGGSLVALSAVGAWFTSGPALCAAVAGLEDRRPGRRHRDRRRPPRLRTPRRTSGGEVISLAERTLRPCVAVARAWRSRLASCGPSAWRSPTRWAAAPNWGAMNSRPGPPGWPTVGRGDRWLRRRMRCLLRREARLFEAALLRPTLPGPRSSRARRNTHMAR